MGSHPRASVRTGGLGQEGARPASGAGKLTSLRAAPQPAHPKLEPLGEFGYLVRWSDEEIDPLLVAEVQGLAATLTSLPGLLDTVPAYASLGLVFDPVVLMERRAEILSLLQGAIAARHRAEQSSHRISNSQAAIEIPVRYGARFGADFTALCQRVGMSDQELIAAHSAPLYTVAMLGFAPGFPYLIGLDDRLHCPRHATPRRQVAAGSVGIAGSQTGIYPIAGPGGWQLIGRTEAALFDPYANPPTLLQPGQRVRFVAVADGK
ncbi:5-oxoprolinase subunit PxpB [Pseudomarimonas arenosa]|uniref:5-oxoprolinase subunit PxpB n=1 Tax=Pseudomarimonas arenosa TaxID=2774145 RepID=UPI002FC306D6